LFHILFYSYGFALHLILHSANHDRRAFVSSASIAAALSLAPGRARSIEVTEPFTLDPALQQKRRETSSKVLFTEGLRP
jgi:hypothetical protein